MDVPANMNRCNPQSYLVITNKVNVKTDPVTEEIYTAIRKQIINKTNCNPNLSKLTLIQNKSVRLYTPKRFLALNGEKISFAKAVLLLGVSESYLHKKLPSYTIQKDNDTISFEYKE